MAKPSVAEDEGGRPELVIPVYLDTTVLLDLLAAVEDGLRLVERITSEERGDTSSERSGSAGFGTPNLFNFFKLGFSGKLGRTKTEGSTETTEAERTHTYGSLLQRLRDYLDRENLLTRLPGDNVSELSGFIEFTGVVRPNPFTNSFEKLQRMLGFAEIVGPMSLPAKPDASNRERRASASQQTAQLKAMGKFIEKLVSDVEREGTSTIVVESGSSTYQAVATLFSDYLRDRSMAELLNREFRVLGKMARHLPEGSTESVDLLASSGIAGFPPEVLDGLNKGVAELGAAGGGGLAAPTATIEPPVVEIVPVAIYL